MPGMDGLETAWTIRRFLPPVGRLPIRAVTANALAEKSGQYRELEIGRPLSHAVRAGHRSLTPPALKAARCTFPEGMCSRSRNGLGDRRQELFWLERLDQQAPSFTLDCLVYVQRSIAGDDDDR